MFDALKALFKQPYWIILLILGALFVLLPCMTVDKDFHLTTHPPTTFVPVVIGAAMLFFSLAIFVFSLWTKHELEKYADAGLNLKAVKESSGIMWTTINGCEVRVINGRLQDQTPEANAAIVLPCNEYFDDKCIGDSKSALGAYINHVFDGQIEAFTSLVKNECHTKLGAGSPQQKTEDECAQSFGAGRCILLSKPLGRSMSIALISTTTQRAGQGLASRISHQFDGMRELLSKLADARLTEAIMPVMGAGHGGIDPPLALVGLLIAIAEAARYGHGSQRLKRVTVVVFKRDESTPPQVASTVVRRALALIGSIE